MKDYKYVVFIFNDPSDNFRKDPKELNILKKVSTGNIRGASCGALNLTVFQSDKTKEEISKMFVKQGISFFLFEEQDSDYKLPSYIAKMFGEKFEKDPDDSDLDEVEKEMFGSKTPKKVSLEDQLQDAINEEDFKMAAVLRDKIAKKKNESTSSEKGFTTKQLFED